MKDYVAIAKGYAEDVASGEVVACLYVRQACQRFLNDLQRDEFEWYLDSDRSDHVCAFIENAIRHVKGPLAGKSLKLQPWQIFILVNIYGWVDEDNYIRKHQTVVLEIARKNGKSLFASALAIYEMLFGEEGAEVYSLATKRDQAKICWEAALQMVDKSHPSVKEKFSSTVSALTNKANWSKYAPLGRDSKSLDGLNPTLCIYDEAAAYSDRNLVEVMTSATGARDNFMHLFITTAQFSRTTIYYENRMHMANILSGKIEGDRWFGMIYTLDDGDEWTDENVWIKANPNIGVSLKTKWLQEQVTEATQMQSKRNNVLVKHFNIYTNAEANWLSPEEWEKCKTDTLKKEGDCYVSMDLSATRDLTAVSMLWNVGEEFHAGFQCFLPRKSMELVPIQIRPLYYDAVDRGVLRLTEGDVVDYREVRDYIIDLTRQYKVKAIGYDKWNANILVNELEEMKLPTISIGQGLAALSGPAKETERMISEGLIRHDGDPFINWQAENCVKYTDPNDNIKIKKGDDEAMKVDAIIALIMNMSMASGTLEEPKQSSISVINF